MRPDIAKAGALPVSTGLLLLGAIHALTFAPHPLPAWLLQFVQVGALAVFALTVLRARTVGVAARLAILFGMGNFTVGLYWISISLHDFGGLALPLSMAAVVLLALFESLFVLLACVAMRCLAPADLDARSSPARHILLAATWASCWTVSEWLRGTLLTGFPWLNIAYAHVDGIFAGWAPVVGAYGMAWLAAYLAGAIALLARANRTSNDTPAAIAVATAMVAALAGIALGHISWGSPHGAPLLVRLVQGNVPQSEKFDPAHMMQGIEQSMMLAALPPKEAGASPAVIVLPETVMPLFQDRYAPGLWDQWLKIAHDRQATILMGIPLHTREHGESRVTNSAIAFSADTPVQRLMSGHPEHRYDKHHLVPFGEFIPPGFQWFVDALHIPLGDFDRGARRQRLFELDGQRFAPDICYEDVFGEEIITAIRPDPELGPGANIMVNLSNLAWFGDSWALRQHLQISRMRAMETARPMLRATNTGMTAAVDSDGRVRAVLDPWTMGVLDVEVQGREGLTPYVRTGNTPVLVLSLLCLLAAGIVRRRHAGTYAQNASN